MKRLWGIRHVRYAVKSWRVHRHARAWARLGVGLGYPNPVDVVRLQMIWRGEA